MRAMFMPCSPSGNEHPMIASSIAFGSSEGTCVIALRTAATQLADRYDTVPEDAWSRTGHRSDGSSFTIDTISRYLVHDIVHHVHDVTPRP